MVFAPFTSVDNHKKNITFDVGLLVKEDVASCSWLFNAFKRAMEHDPMSIVTEQDPSMRWSIPKVFPNTRHRFCMWHIMNKLPAKVSSSSIPPDANFSKKFSSLVWKSYSEPAEFEAAWYFLLKDYGYADVAWFS